MMLAVVIFTESATSSLPRLGQVNTDLVDSSMTDICRRMTQLYQCVSQSLHDIDKARVGQQNAVVQPEAGGVGQTVGDFPE